MIAISNASPLISLSSVGALDLLASLFTTIHIPEAVYEEIAIAGAGRAGSAEVAAATWIRRHVVTDIDAVRQLMTDAKLKTGESETLILAAELNADLVIIDERPARRYALAQGLPIAGTLGVLLLAKTRGLLPEVRPLLHALSAAGMRLSSTLYVETLRRAGE